MNRIDRTKSDVSVYGYLDISIIIYCSFKVQGL